MNDHTTTASESAAAETDLPAAAAATTGLVAGNVDSGPRVLVVDNYDSFVYNLVQYVGEFAGEIAVQRNDALDLAAVRALDPDGIVLSPGPGTPASAGVSMDVADLDRPIFGVCLGHQALCAARGSRVDHAPTVVHGKASTITHDGEGLFAGLDAALSVGRYHSLCVDRDDLPAALVETAHTTDDREIVMGVRHRDRPQFGVQFHPESILTDAGKAMVANFVDICEAHDD
ncbi:MAG: glutamine amidotransferase of anthranilate synthase or aminodeoxychorismate synthase [Halonotius sp. J07HN6]|nr:MAG: glutamine amidotransferase of anthranilate synthase or aminodeoxychorismate synthase [Halonotius sp. J07HN6]